MCLRLVWRKFLHTHRYGDILCSRWCVTLAIIRLEFIVSLLLADLCTIVDLPTITIAQSPSPPSLNGFRLEILPLESNFSLRRKTSQQAHRKIYMCDLEVAG
jgi:hypothetical protein